MNQDKFRPRTKISIPDVLLKFNMTTYETIERVERISQDFEKDVENLPIIGVRYDKTLYGEYSDRENYQSYFEKQSSTTIYTLALLMGLNEFNIVNLLVYAVNKRKSLADLEKTSFGWRDPRSIPLVTPLVTHSRKELRELACISPESIENESIVENGAIFYITDWNHKITSSFNSYEKLSNYICSYNRNYLPQNLEKESELFELFTHGIFKGTNKTLGILACALNLYMEEEGPNIDFYLLLEYLYQKALQKASITKVVRRIAKLHYYLCIKTPMRRGGGALAEWIASALMLFHKIDFIGWKIEPWNYAVTREVSRFVEEYPDYVEVR